MSRGGRRGREGREGGGCSVLGCKCTVWMFVGEEEGVCVGLGWEIVGVFFFGWGGGWGSVGCVCLCGCPPWCLFRFGRTATAATILLN